MDHNIKMYLPQEILAVYRGDVFATDWVKKFFCSLLSKYLVKLKVFFNQISNIENNSCPHIFEHIQRLDLLDLNFRI